MPERKCRKNIRSEAFGSMICLMNKHRHIMFKRLESTGVYQGQHRLLMIIAENPSSSQVELAKQMEVSTSTVAVSLKKLEKGGYIRRSASEGDNRYNIIEITDKGSEAVRKSREIFSSIDNGMFEGFTDDEIFQLMEYIERLSNNLDERRDNNVKD